MPEFRRGLEQKKYRYVWQNLWHFDEGCPSFPRRAFEVRRDRPSDDELCAKCHTLSRAKSG